MSGAVAAVEPESGKRHFRFKRVLLVTVSIVAVAGVSALLGWDIRGWFRELWDTISRQDWRIVERAHLGVWLRGVRGWVYPPHDRPPLDNARRLGLACGRGLVGRATPHREIGHEHGGPMGFGNGRAHVSGRRPATHRP